MGEKKRGFMSHSLVYKHPHMVISYYLKATKKDWERRRERKREREICVLQILGWEQAMGRPPCCDKVGIKKGPWTPEEDIILVSYIQEHGPGNWRAVPTNTGKQPMIPS